jgi:hypothetical protein
MEKIKQITKWYERGKVLDKSIANLSKSNEGDRVGLDKKDKSEHPIEYNSRK